MVSAEFRIKLEGVMRDFAKAQADGLMTFAELAATVGLLAQGMELKPPSPGLTGAMAALAGAALGANFFKGPPEPEKKVDRAP